MKAFASRLASSLAGETVPRRPRVTLSPKLRTIYAIGDVHGHLDALLRLERVIAEDASVREGPSLTILLGDYVDRGPRSADTLAHLSRPATGLPRLCLCGNHEAAMQDFLQRPGLQHPWLGMGGIETLAAYGIDIAHVFSTYRKRPDRLLALLAEAIPAEQIGFLKALPALAANDRFVFVHAGVRPGVAPDRQRDDDLLWIREPFLSRGPEWGERIVVHGHSVTKTISLIKGRIGIDRDAHRTGELLALRLGEDGMFTLSSEA
ncbi:metallophosphoesterase family protein [Aureimonas sp. ME7]|uniref:metallophosphoesterase family protein n=1 Tax=Aureimonas sp. ME7 TaxID=2744252 RepID=UPI0015F7D5D3|nr:metallophosphoesterase family protein [Aureimonas sp. ME7]